jgi:DNA modification methylase
MEMWPTFTGVIAVDSSLEEIELEVLTLHNSINVRGTVERAKRIGELLLAAKARLPHGGYLPWLKKLGLNRKTAHDYIVIAKAPNVRSAGHLGIGAVLTLLRAGRKADRQEQADELAEGVLPTQEQKIVTADSLEWMAEQKPDSFPFIISDPPFGLGLTYDDWTESDTPEGYWRWMKPFWTEMQRILMPGGSVLLWQSYKRFAYLGEWFPNARIVADCRMMRGRTFWEPLIAWQKPGPHLVRFHGPNDWFIGQQGGKAHDPYARLHPCVRSVEECREVVKRFTLPGSLVLDPFAGTGAVCRAALLEGRDFIGVERSARFADLARKRVRGSGNKKAGNVSPLCAGQFSRGS